ncbi:MAG TPA: hypothetical protein VFH60_10520 [Chloroflexia bacterium]|nr:hypothetical protein [Chloroflexia bacterium]
MSEEEGFIGTGEGPRLYYNVVGGGPDVVVMPGSSNDTPPATQL